MKKFRTSVELKSKSQYEALQRIAANLGYFQTRGVGTGKVGSVSQVWQDLADGKLKIIKSD